MIHHVSDTATATCAAAVLRLGKERLALTLPLAVIATFASRRPTCISLSLAHLTTDALSTTDNTLATNTDARWTHGHDVTPDN